MRHAAPIVTVLLGLLLQACGSTPAQPPPSSSGEVPELTLNLPEESCVCPEQHHDYTFLERGYAELAQGEHIEAVQYFNRYQRLEASPSADWEAAIAIAFLSASPSSPFYDPREARTLYRRLRTELTEQMQVHDVALVMRDALDMFMGMDRQVRDLRENVDILSEDLQKREAALRRLRELTLGQPAEPR